MEWQWRGNLKSKKYDWSNLGRWLFLYFFLFSVSYGIAIMIKVLLKLKDLNFYGFLTECWPIIFRTSRAETRQVRYLHGSFWSLPWWSFDLPPYCLLRDFFCAVIFFPRRPFSTVFVDEGPNSDTQQVWRIEESRCFVLMISSYLQMIPKNPQEWCPSIGGSTFSYNLGTRLGCPICFFFVGSAPSTPMFC